MQRPAGKRRECIFTGMIVTGVIEDMEDWAWGRKSDEFGMLHHLQLLEDKPDF